MNSVRRDVVIAAAAFLLSASGIAHAQDEYMVGLNRIAGPQEFISAAQTCIKAVSDQGVSLKSMTEAGWLTAEFDGEGVKKNQNMTKLLKPESGIVILGSGQGDHIDGCMILGNIAQYCPDPRHRGRFIEAFYDER